VQVFLSPKGSGIYEVELTTDGNEVRCNCPTYKSRRDCRHVKFVLARMDGGAYPIQVHPSARDEDLDEHLNNPEAFRRFIVKYGKIEVV
jgi:uncharacterized Zn finger protein